MHKLQAYFLKITSGRWPPFTSMHCCKRVWNLLYTRLRRSSIAATSSTMACLSSWIVMIRHWNTRSFRNALRKKSGDRAGQVMSPKREITVPNISRTTAILFRNIWNGILSSTVPLAANHDKLSQRRNIPIRNVSRLRATLYYTFWVSVCGLGYPARNAHAPYCHLWPVRLYNTFTRYLTNGTIFGKCYWK